MIDMAAKQPRRNPSHPGAHLQHGPDSEDRGAEGLDEAQPVGQTLRRRSDSTSETRPRRRKSEVRQRTEVVVFRLLPGERELLAAAAAEQEISLSELIRTSVLKAIEP